MRKYFRIPFYFLILAALIGLVLRLHLVSPIHSLQYGNWLHAHSHIMFLGWLFNFFSLAFVYHFRPDAWNGIYKKIFVVNQVLVGAMSVFFPLYGYVALTIALSAIHTLVSAFFCFRFVRDTRHINTIARWLAVWSLIFFLVSAIGPFSLGPIMASGAGRTQWYYFAVYFYLHFQYNGFFLFGVLALLFGRFNAERWAEYRGIRVALWTMIPATFVTYVLSVLWARPGIAFNLTGLGFAVVQAVAFVVLLVYLRRHVSEVQQPGLAPVLIRLAIASLVLKFVLQIVSASPEAAQLAYDNRYFVIVYLHLVLVGGITFFVFAWYLLEGFGSKVRPVFVILLIAGFVLSELLLITITSTSVFGSAAPFLILFFSLIMFSGIAGFAANVLET